MATRIGTCGWQYEDAALRTWLRRINETWASHDDVFVYFNNNPGAAAIKNAKTLQRIAAN